MFNTDGELTDRGIDMSVLYNASGEAFNLQEGQGIWVSYARAETSFDLSGSLSGSAKKLDIELNGVNITADIPDATDESMVNNIAIAINAESSKTGVSANVSGTTITLSNDNNLGADSRTKNIDLNVKNTTGTDDTGLYDAKVITAYQYAYDPNSDGTTTHDYDDETVRAFKTTEDLRKAMQEDARRYTNYTGEKVGDGPDDATGGGDDITWDAGATTDVLDANYNPGATVTVNSEGQFQIENFQNSTAFDPAFISTATSDEDFDGYLQNSDVTFPSETDLENGIVIELPATFTGSIDITYGGGTPLGSFTGGDEIIIPAGAAPSGGIILDNSITLPEGTRFLDGASGTPLSDPLSGGSLGNITPPTNQSITVNQNDGTADPQSMYLTISELTNSDGVNDVSANQRFVTAFRALQGALVEGGSIRTSQNLYAANHASSIDIYDSLGSKHTVRIEFTKTGFTTDGGTRWSMMISVPEPGEINFTGAGLSNVLTGEISFNSDGSLATYNPSSITYTANNGSTPNQNILLDFGTLGQFDGMTSFDQQSNTSGISQDGYPGGDLAGIRVDETGTLIGSFTNGRSFGLAQVSMAKFTNNGGLESDGGNTFIQTSNSGDPIIGQANIGGRGFIQASSLEMSNVDLSRSLTQLIIVQRGYQANSKTITTSDQMLETLLQLKR
jgi:flagellar hook protein FlgE